MVCIKWHSGTESHGCAVARGLLGGVEILLAEPAWDSSASPLAFIPGRQRDRMANQAHSPQALLSRSSICRELSRVQRMVEVEVGRSSLWPRHAISFLSSWM